MIKKIPLQPESRVEAYPKSTLLTPEKGPLPFVWSDTEGVCKWVLVLGTVTADTDVVGALLLQFMGKMTDWLDKYTPATLFAEEGWALAAMATVMLFLIGWALITSSVRLQVLRGVFPIHLCWSLHRLMLNQNLGFHQDGFAGCVSAKVMQTILALHSVVMMVTDMAVCVLAYFVTSGAILVAPNGWPLLPFIGWAAGFALVMRLLIPKLDRTAMAQADTRSLITGRIIDAYSNIATIKLFSHGTHGIAYAKQSMGEFVVTVHAQVRLTTLLHTYSFIVNASLTLSTVALGIWFWCQGQIDVGTVATAIAMALRVNGLPQYIMREPTRLFEDVGTVSNDMRTLFRPHIILGKL